MASISKIKSNGNYKLVLSKEELNTVHIAIANFNILDMEEEAIELGLDQSEVSYSHLELFDKLDKVTKLYKEV